MNTRKIILAAISLAWAVCSIASPLTPAQALERLHIQGTRHTKAEQANKLIKTWTDEEGLPVLYLYTYSGSEGFLLLSADDTTAPLIGYSETNPFQTEEQPENLRSWLSNCVEGISQARKTGVVTTTVSTRAGERDAIEPMIATRWDQTNPYNNECPTIEGRRCVTGCVATAMAQVMNYWQYPATGRGSVTYTPETMEEELSLDFSTIEFDWASMQTTYRGGASETAKRAVALLMKACGYSVKMRYSPFESGAYSRDIANAFTSYFGYDQGIQHVDRSGYQTQEEWNSMIYNELANVGPVIYNGLSAYGAHCFICDGYDGAGLFHINWGWGGTSDGYFLLNELTPGEVGTGGHYGGYNMNQTAVTGILPPVGRITESSIIINNAADDSGNVKGWGYTYRINDFSNIQLSVDLRITGGHISSPLYVSVYDTDPDTKKNLSTVLESEFDQPLEASDGLTTCSTRLGLPNYDPSKLYTLNVAYELKGQKSTIGSIRMAASSGVDDVIAEDAQLEVYSVAGLLLASGNKEIALAGLPSGIYVVKCVNADGSGRTFKLLLK